MRASYRQSYFDFWYALARWNANTLESKNKVKVK